MARRRRRRYYQQQYSRPVRGDAPVDINAIVQLGGAIVAVVVAAFSGAMWLGRRIFKRAASGNVPSITAPLAPRQVLQSLPPTIQTSRKTIDGNPIQPAEPDIPMPYKSASYILSKGERAFWYPLYRAVKGKYRVFPKVRLADVVTPEKVWGRQRWFKKIGHFHVDFVVCEPHTTKPLLVIELDDRSHRRLGRKDKDEFKDRVLAAAGLPIYRVRCQQAYDVAEITENIRRLLAATPK